MKSYLIEPENNIIMGFNLDYINSNNILLESFGFNINNLLESFSANYKIWFYINKGRVSTLP